MTTVSLYYVENMRAAVIRLTHTSLCMVWLVYRLYLLCVDVTNIAKGEHVFLDRMLNTNIYIAMNTTLP